MSNAILSASQLRDLDNSLLNGSINFNPASGPGISIAVSGGAFSGQVPPGTYEIQLNNSYTSVVDLTGILIADGANMDLDTLLNSPNCALLDSIWWFVNPGDFVPSNAAVISLPTNLPIVTPATSADMILSNTGSGGATVGAAVPIGNGASPGRSFTLPQMGVAHLRYIGSNWRIVALSTAPQ